MNELLEGTYSMVELMAHHNIHDWQEKDAMRFLRGLYIMKKSGRDYIVKKRLKFKDFDWAEGLYPVDYVKLHLGNWQLQMEENNYTYTISEDGYIDARPKEEVQEMTVSNNSFTNTGTGNIITGNNNIIINFSGDIGEYLKGIESLKGYTNSIRYSKKELRKLCSTLEHGNTLYICAEALCEHINMNNKVINGQGREITLTAKNLSEMTDGLVSKSTINNYKVIEALQDNNIIKLDEDKHCMVNPRIETGRCPAKKNNEPTDDIMEVQDEYDNK